MFIKSLSEELAICFRKTFEYRWKKVNGRTNNNLRFYNFVFGCNHNSEYFNNEIYDCIEKAIIKINREEYFSDNSNKLSDEQLFSIKSILDEKVPNIFENIQFFGVSQFPKFYKF